MGRSNSHRPASQRAGIWLCLLITACAADGAGGVISDGGGAQNGDVYAGLPFHLPVDEPIESGTYADLMGWLIEGSHGSWESEAGVRRSTQGSAGVRIFLNPSLAESMAEGALEHPVGAMAIRELYADDLQTLEGFALAIKTGAHADPAQSWFWLEVFGLDPDSEPIIAEHAAPGCMSCHSEGVDFIRSPYPLP